MKKSLPASLVVLALAYLAAVPKTTAQSSAKSPQALDATTPNSSPVDTAAVNIDGIVGTDGKTLQADTGKTWDIGNPKTLKHHVGQHVTVHGTASGDSHSITVESVQEFANKARSSTY